MKASVLPASLEPQRLTGVVPSAVAPVVWSQLVASGAPVGVVWVTRERDAERLTAELQTLTEGQLDGRYLPTLPDPDADDPRAFELRLDRLTIAADLLSRRDEVDTKPLVVVCTPEAWFQPAPSAEALQEHQIALTVGASFDFQELVRHLGEELDYDHEVVCETPGQFAVRGGLIDVYPVNADRPYRIDFFGDEIESIRSFDPTDQRSLDPVTAISLTTLPRDDNDNGSNLTDLLPAMAHWLLIEPNQLASDHEERFFHPERLKSQQPGLREVLEVRKGCRDRWQAVGEFEDEAPMLPEAVTALEVTSETLESHREFEGGRVLGAERTASDDAARQAFLKQLGKWQAEGLAVSLVASSAAEEERLREVLKKEAPALAVRFRQGSLQAGVVLRQANMDTLSGAIPEGSAGVVLATDREVLGRFQRRVTLGRRRMLPTRSKVDQALDFTELVDGDALVHIQHGVCLFRGLTRMDLRGKEEEVFSLEFAEGVTLHLPLSEVHLLSRYVGLAKSKPKLAKLGGQTWNRARKAAEKATRDFAADLLRLQATRDAQPGFAFGDDTDEQHSFESAFPHQETPDQLTAITETKADMERDRPMDRLVCGDVGYGKTEVALRAAFKSAIDGKQVVLLVPTTVLAQQHYITFRERLAAFPLTVEMLSRFRSPQEQKEIIAQTADGRIDILVGTHRLLSRDLQFKDLGLIIVDEEHRFGVQQKERLKELRTSVDVLSMSATPIPRTLYLALMGARDLSVIETPPVDRLPIQTFVKTYEPKLVKQAIEAEVARGGQVFYLHNRVQTIDKTLHQLQDAMPDLRFGMGHGQMDKDLLEKVMTEFVAGQYDVLVCTTIIESGLDIPNCNTMIIEGADRFGLAQLYQLRGRVGRFNRQAYAYLLLHKSAKMLDPARKRLSAIRQYNELGAGFRIAMRDLELRGAGNLLGAEQSGHIAAVGFNLYCQLLRQSVAKLKGDASALNDRAAVLLDFVNTGESIGEDDSHRDSYTAIKAAEEGGTATELQQVVAGLPESYLGETRLRIDFYRRFATATNPDEVQSLRDNLRDRFGRFPAEVEALARLSEIRVLAEQRGLQSVKTEGSRLICLRASGQVDDYVKVGARFPRLQKRDPFDKLTEIKSFLLNQPRNR